MKFDTIITYCTVDDIFIRENIKQCLFFSKDIYIIVSSHFFDGTPEDETKVGALKEYCKQFPNVHLIRFRWDNTKSTSYWHSYMRWVGVQQCTTEWIMFMDSDEIFEGEIASQSLQDAEFFKQYDECVFSCYWYFREPVFRAKTTEMAHKLVRASIITKKDFLSENEFGWIGFSGKYRCIHNVKYNGRPILHHFSWVRTKEEMLRKTSSWAHKNDKNWKELIEEEFSRPFNGTDFVHGYEYDIINPPFEFPNE